MFSTPILLITFNRPKHVRRVLEEIRKQRPMQLFVAQDGPRSENEDDVQRISIVREVITELVDWDCELHTLYQEQNLGCGAGPVAAIAWFFSQVEQGIVMEDDCLPHPNFFGYCEQLLCRYKENERVQLINATLYADNLDCDASYCFSHYLVTGAWAAWQRTWSGFDLDLHSLNPWKLRRKIYAMTGNSNEADWWYFKIKEIQQDRTKKSYWDYQMQILLFAKGALTIQPRVNLISNIGFDAEGTHTMVNDGRGNRELYPILPLVPPKEIAVSLNTDNSRFAKVQSICSWQRVWSFVYRSMLYSDGVGHWLLMRYKQLKYGKKI